MTFPSRLYRAFSVSPDSRANLTGANSLFRVILGNGTELLDRDIKEITIRRGSGQPAASLSPSTCSVSMVGTYTALSGAAVDVKLGEALTASIAAGAGLDVSDVWHRFRGRIGTSALQDRGARRPVSSSFVAVSWSAQLLYSTRSHANQAGVTMVNAIRNIMYEPRVPLVTTVTSMGTEFAHVAMPATKLRDAIGPWITDLGYRIMHTNDGHLLIYGLPSYHDALAAEAATLPPLLTAQVLAPSEYVQPVESTERRYYATITELDQTRRVISAGGDESTSAEDAIQLDWTRLRSSGEPGTHAWQALIAQSLRDKPRALYPGTLEVDLLALMRRGSPVDLQAVGYLLKAREGSALVLAGDWRPYLVGVHVITGITETISHNRWTLSISVVPITLITGLPSPTVHGRTWDSTLGTWDAQTGTWN